MYIRQGTGSPVTIMQPPWLLLLYNRKEQHQPSLYTVYVNIQQQQTGMQPSNQNASPEVSTTDPCAAERYLFQLDFIHFLFVFNDVVMTCNIGHDG